MPARSTLASMPLRVVAAVLALPAAECSLAQALPDARSTFVQAEVVGAWQQRNSVQSPNDAAGTRFALDDVTGNGPFQALRLEGFVPIGTRQQLSFLIVPLAIEETGRLPRTVRFEGGAFSAGTTTATYRFDSYRVGWRWLFVDRSDLTVKFGATAKVRDAEIRLRQGAQSRRKTDTGFVPLAHASFERRAGSGWFVAGDVDALGGGPGYAVDAGLRVGRHLGGRWSVFGGLRFLDGGADTDEVHAFARFTSVTVGLRYRQPAAP